MDHWPTGTSSLSSQSGDLRSTKGPRPLKAVSGNRQTFALDCYAGPESQPHQDLYSHCTNSSLIGSRYLPNTFPTPITLGSNDHERASQRLHHRHQRRHKQHGPFMDARFQDRSYLTSEQYLDYRARQRKDLGKDNKQVWSDDVEEAFQEALFEIEPMGRRQRRSQHGKPNGRNELISEYIFHRTGERRDRKQVSSHIQVLKKLLEEIPSWRNLTNETAERADSANRGYYSNSIEHKVEQRRQSLIGQQSSYQTDANFLPPPLQTLGSNSFPTGGRRVTGVNFEMWMSPNQGNMDKRLHDFTSLQTARDLPRCEASPLENVGNWRSSYPCLAATLDRKGTIPSFDILMIETSYKMMSEFPPPKATLGLRLELDFGKNGQDDLTDWTCTTHIYNNGVAVKQASHYRLESNWGMVAPPFESMWWALIFIDKVEQKKQAEETGKRDVFHVTQQKTHEFFSQLTAVHEIRARPPLSASASELKLERSLVAVLLWKFSIAPESYVGTTSWQRLLPPPARIATNNPLNPQDMSMAPFAIDTIVEDQHYPSDLGDNKDLLGEPLNHAYQDYRLEFDNPNALLGHHDFGMAFKEGDVDNFAATQSSFIPPSQGEQDSQSFHTLDNFGYDMQLPDLPTPSHHDTYHHPTSANIFESQDLNQTDLNEHHHHTEILAPPPPPPPLYALHQDIPHEDDDDDNSPRRPLATFDHNTHNLLQAQLGEPADPPDQQMSNDNDDDDVTLTAVLAAASVMNDPGNPHLELPLQDNDNNNNINTHQGADGSQRQDRIPTWDQIPPSPGLPNADDDDDDDDVLLLRFPPQQTTKRTPSTSMSFTPASLSNHDHHVPNASSAAVNNALAFSSNHHHHLQQHQQHQHQQHQHQQHQHQQHQHHDQHQHDQHQHVATTFDPRATTIPNTTPTSIPDANTTNPPPPPPPPPPTTATATTTTSTTTTNPTTTTAAAAPTTTTTTTTPPPPPNLPNPTTQSHAPPHNPSAESALPIGPSSS